MLHRGFTLVELMITLIVVAILAAVAMPAFVELVQSNRMVSQANSLLSALNLGRAEAIKRSARVTLCPSPAGTACDSTTDWDSGWLVFVDSDEDTTFDAGEEILAVGQSFPSGMTARGTGTVGALVSYVGTGLSQTAGGAALSGTIQLCDGRGVPFARSIKLDATGRARVRKGAAVCP